MFSTDQVLSENTACLGVVLSGKHNGKVDQCTPTVLPSVESLVEFMVKPNPLALQQYQYHAQIMWHWGHQREESVLHVTIYCVLLCAHYVHDHMQTLDVCPCTCVPGTFMSSFLSPKASPFSSWVCLLIKALPCQRCVWCSATMGPVEVLISSCIQLHKRQSSPPCTRPVSRTPVYSPVGLGPDHLALIETGHHAHKWPYVIMSASKTLMSQNEDAFI